MGKSLFASKTLAANAIAVGVALFQYHYGPIQAADPELFAAALAILNIVLRFTTTQPLTVMVKS